MGVFVCLGGDRLFMDVGDAESTLNKLPAQGVCTRQAGSRVCCSLLVRSVLACWCARSFSSLHFA